MATRPEDIRASNPSDIATDVLASTANIASSFLAFAAGAALAAGAEHAWVPLGDRAESVGISPLIGYPVAALLGGGLLALVTRALVGPRQPEERWGRIRRRAYTLGGLLALLRPAAEYAHLWIYDVPRCPQDRGFTICDFVTTGPPAWFVASVGLIAWSCAVVLPAFWRTRRTGGLPADSAPADGDQVRHEA